MPGSPVTKTSCRWPCNGPVQTRAQRLQRARASHQGAVCWGHRGGGRRRRSVVDRGDEAVPAPGQRLNKPRGLRPVPERAADLEDAAFQDLRLDVRLGPHRRKELLLRHQLSGMLHQIAQDGKRLGRQQHALVVGCLPAAPETLIAGVQPEWGKVLHGRLRQCWSVVRHGRGPDGRPRARAFWPPRCAAVPRPRIAQTILSRFCDHNVTARSRLHPCKRVYSRQRRDAWDARTARVRPERPGAPGAHGPLRMAVQMPSRVPPRVPQRHAGTPVTHHERRGRCCSTTCSTRRR